MSKIREILEQNHKCRLIPPEDAKVDFDIDKAEAEIEAEISARKEEWKKELLEKLPKEKEIPDETIYPIYRPPPKDGDMVSYIYINKDERRGWNNCLNEIKKLIEEV